jgi:uncharacterized repeat protein (TIGR01451 family)
MFSFSLASSQTTTYLERAYEYIQNEYGLDPASIGELKIKDQYKSDHNQVEHLYLVQSYRGIDILGTGINLAFLPNGKVMASGHRLTIMDGAPITSVSAKVDAPHAIGIVAAQLGIATRSTPVLTRQLASGVPVYSKEDISLQDIPAELVYLYHGDQYRLVWKLQIESKKHGNLYQSYVDATTGEHITNDVLTLHCSFEDGYLAHDAHCTSHEAITTIKTEAPPVNALGQYKVLPLGVESPAHGAFELVTGFDDVLASPFGWHDADGVAGHDYTITRGNNVHAFLDRNWDYAPDGDLDGGPGLLFDFPYDEMTEPSANQDVALTNLFFWNNIMHDFAYQYGFTEVAGNFQSMNYGGMGSGEDFVEAHAQFGDNNPGQCGIEVNGNTDCLNNADFSTPVDGFNGRMRMFTWDRDNSNKHLDILEPAEFSGKILTGLAEFGAEITSTPVTGDVVIADDGSSSPSHACLSLNEQSGLDGKIVIIDRGLCDFSEKVFNAQEGGAIGAIICNFDETVITMGAGFMAGEVVIPSVFISKGDCDRIRVAAANGLRASLVAPEAEGGPVRRDGSLDNSVIAHEYAHGISTRLSWGPSNSGCLSPGAQTGDAEEAHGMGEGWSDFFALVTTVRPGDTGEKKRGIGTFANKENTDGRGIRSYPYSTDMSINPHTYDDILFESVPHGVGSVWTAMLWDLYWALSDAYGWDPDLYNGTGGNNIAVQLVMDGLKFLPCPGIGFIDARDAILQADQINNNGVNECLIWEVFARRGLGWDADGGTPESRSDGVQGFSPLPSCVKELKLIKSMTPEIVAGDAIEVTLYAVNHTDAQLTNVFLEDPLPDGATYIAGSGNIEPAVGNSLVWNFDTVEPGEEITITYMLTTDPAKNSVRVHFDDIEGDAFLRWDVYFDEAGTTDNFWTQQDVLVRSGIYAWNVGDVATESEHFLQNFEPYQISGDYPLYRFYHYYNTETGADGGFLEISTNGGNSWQSLEDKIFRNGYPRRLQYTTFAIPNLYAFSGVSNTELEMTPVYIDLSEYAGQEVLIRYRFGTDDNTPGDGWYVDDVELMDAVLYNSTACITSDQTDAVCAEAPERGTIVDSQIIESTEDGDATDALYVAPNPAGDYIQTIITAERSEDAVVRVFDLNGKALYTRDWNLTEGSNQLSIDLTRLSSGMYILHISTGKTVVSKKFVKR